MKTIIFEDEITISSINDLIADIEKIEENEDYLIEERKKYFERNIYFSSPGGEVPAAFVLIDYINNTKQFIFNLNGYWNISSSAFMIFSMAKCERRLIGDDAFSIIHEFDRDSSIRELKKSKSIDKFLNEEMTKNNEKVIEWFRQIGITEEQIELVKSGEDVTIDHIQLREIIETTKNIFKDQMLELEDKNIIEELSLRYGEEVIIISKKSYDDAMQECDCDDCQDTEEFLQSRCDECTLDGNCDECDYSPIPKASIDE